MQVYLVGGAVRDHLLGHTVQERDWVVTGATPEQMIAQGYTPVGKDFPVFLHPQTKDEYALARTERKQGRGYHGFEFYTDPSITLEQDLARRDLTINAIAQAADGRLIDPYNGRADLDAGRLRHVSPAFSEDPVRLLRIARFAARFHHLGFTVADETRQLLQKMVTNGEVDTLVPERVWKELSRALSEPDPQVFIQVLRQMGALARLMPEVDNLYGIPQKPQWHPEIDTGIHIELCLKAGQKLNVDNISMFAILCHDLGKAATPTDQLPAHHGHEERGVPLCEQLAARLRCPAEYRDMARLAARWHLHSHKAFELKPGTILKLFYALDLWRRPHRLAQFLSTCWADRRGRLGSEQSDYPQADLLRRAFAAAKAIQPAELARAGFTGLDLRARLDQQRCQAIKHVCVNAAH